MFVRLIASAALMAGFMLAPRLSAGSSEWVTVASACVPDEGSTGKFQTDFGRFMFLGNQIGSVDARCNVVNPSNDLGAPGISNPGWNQMEVTYADTDGTNSTSQVVVTLRRVDRFTGASTLIATFDSNTRGPGQQVFNMPLNHTFNFRDYGYYVGISVKRTNSAQVPKISRVRLGYQPIT